MLLKIVTRYPQQGRQFVSMFNHVYSL